MIFRLIFISIVFSIGLNAKSFKLDKYSKIVTTDETISMQNASFELQKYLWKILAESIKISKTIDSKNLSIILTKKDSSFASNLSFYNKLKSLKDDSFIIKTKANSIIIAATNDRALFYGIYHFLEYYLGCKFLSSEYEKIPKKDTITISSIDDIQEPRFSYREFFSSESDNHKFSLKSRLNGRLGHRNSQEYIDDMLPRGRAIYNSFVSSQLITEDKYKCNGQYDFSKNKVANLALKSVKKSLSKLDISKDDYIAIDHEDRDSYCTNGLNNNTESGDMFLNYASSISKRLAVNTLYQAYQWSRTPPKIVKKLPKNMTIFFSPIEADFSKPLLSKQNKDISDDLKKWNSFENDIIVWHYVTNFGGYFQPYPNLYALDKDIKFFTSLKRVNGVFLQSSYGTFGGELADLRTWIFSKLLWNPTLKIDDLVSEFCDGFYGKASKDVQLYIKTLHKIQRKMGGKLPLKSSISSKYLHHKFLEYLEDILDKGDSKLPNDSIEKKHLQSIYSGIDYIRVMRGDSGENLDKSKRRLRDFLSSHNDINYFAEGGEIENIKQVIDIDRKKSVPPVLVKGLKQGIDWYEFQEYALKLCCADLVEDSQSSDGVSAVMKGSLGDWGFQLDVLNFPKGKWDIYVDVKIEYEKSKGLLDSGSIAFYYGIHPTIIKGGKLFAQCEDGKYMSVKVGTIDTQKSDAKTIWLSPASNKLVKNMYVDRIFIKRGSK
jgi:hypothetical protein